jgi:2-polyprenyl-3-methyl-5-hydroxy-6-metoxy-1,4-benzoquinol methylase
MVRHIVKDISSADDDVRYVPEETGTNSRSAIMHKSRYHWLLGVVDVCNASILDFGCGSGYGAGFLAERGARVLGIDISPAAIDYATNTFPRASFRVHDLTDSGLPTKIPERFDIIVSFDVIEHVEKWWTFLHNVRALVKQGGVAIVGCPNRISHFDFNPLWNRFHVQEFTPAQLEWLARTKFNDVTVLGQKFLDPIARERNTARPLSAAYHIKEALLQTPLRAPVRNFVRLLHGSESSRSIKTRAPEDLRHPSTIVFERIDMQDEAALREPFGIVAICQ